MNLDLDVDHTESEEIDEDYDISELQTES